MDTAPLNTPFPAVIPFVFPGIPQVQCAFGTARAGDTARHAPGSPHEPAARQARTELRKALEMTSWVELNQVHGDTILIEPEPTAPDAAVLPEADGSFTSRPGLALAVKTADCQPILLAAKDGRAVAALHAGWRGNALKFPTSGVERFCRTYSLDPKDVVAVRGPSLGPAAAEFVNFEQEWAPAFRPWFNEATRTMDLWSLTRSQLMDAGLPAEHIFSLDLCTRSLPGLFFSYRRGHTGRQMALIQIAGTKER